MARSNVVLLAMVALWGVQAVKMQESAEARAAVNPIRKVVTMLQDVVKKVEEEGKKEEELYQHFMCYCKTSGGDLDKSIAAAGGKIPEVEAAIKETDAQIAQLTDDLENHKADREAAKTAMAEATALREKEAKEYAAMKAESSADIDAINTAVAALEKGMAGAFLQTPLAAQLKRALQASEDIVDEDRQEVLAFLSASGGDEYAPQSGQITGILKQIGDTMAKGLAEAIAEEEAAIVAFEELMVAKKKEVAALTKSIEEKTVRMGELGVEIVNMKEDLGDTQKALLEDKKFLEDLQTNCDTKTAEWEEIKKTRAEELLALADTIKILNDDDALDLFKKALPSPSVSFVQVKVSALAMRSRALSMLRQAAKSGAARPQLDLIELALNSKFDGFGKVIAMIDDMTTLLKKEQVDDESKKVYCNTEFDNSDDKRKALERGISDADAAIADAEDAISTLTSEIAALVDGIKQLDKAVAEATENRKKEHEEFKELMAQDSAAKELIEFAKNRLNKFYNPKLYNPPPKRELSEEDKIVTAFGGTAAPTPAPGGIAGTGVTVFAELGAHAQSKEAPPPPPETFGPYTAKSEESNGVIAMMDMLVRDLDKEMTTAGADEKHAQASYEKTMADSAEKRADDSKSVADKEAVKADTQAALQEHQDTKASTTKELMGTLETIKALHSECDWLLENFDARKEARKSEIKSLDNAKAVLSGADYSDYSLVQIGSRSLRGRMWG